MDRRKKGSGQITHVPGRKSPWRACVVDNTGKQKIPVLQDRKGSQGIPSGSERGCQQAEVSAGDRCYFQRVLHHFS